MTNYMVIYSGGMGMSEDPDVMQQVMAEWGTWYEKLGSAIVDDGAPFGHSKHITADGAGDGPLGDTPATGYTIIGADTIEAATAACEGHPHIKYGGQVQVFECFDMSANQ